MRGDEQMDSFGVYVKPKSGGSTYDATLHVNIWELPKKRRCILRSAKPGCCVDFGLLIKNYRQLSAVMIAIPFVIKPDDFQDLSPLLGKVDGLCNAIFNRVASFTQKTPMGKNGSTAYTLTVNDVMPNGAVLYPLKADKNLKIEGGFSYVSLELDSLSLQSDQTQLKDLYIRFRIKGETLAKQLLSPITKANLFLESGFKKTEMIDFKINEIRNIDQAITNKVETDGFKPASFQRVYFFIMEAATNEVDAAGINAECRKLEDIWEKYIGTSVSNTVAYQWEKRAKEENGSIKPFMSFSQLTKVTYSGTNWKIIALYIVAVLLLSILSNWFYDGLCRLIP